MLPPMKPENGNEANEDIPQLPPINQQSLFPNSIPPISSLSQDSIPEDEKPHRRHLHIQSEQRRRERITDGFAQLRNAVPTVRHGQVSKASILKKAAEHIEILEYQSHTLQQRVSILEQQNISLHHQLHSMGKIPSSPLPPLLYHEDRPDENHFVPAQFVHTPSNAFAAKPNFPLPPFPHVAEKK